MNPEDPTTAAEWQEAADLADFLLCVDSARQFGLVEGGPMAKIERCKAILKRAAKRGIHPRKDEETLCRLIRTFCGSPPADTTPAPS
jgi:hypothetical protein